MTNIEIKYDSLDVDLMAKYKLLRENDVLLSPIKNFSRFDRLSKLIFLTYIINKHELDIESLDIEKTALLLVDENGSNEINNLYFNDYVDSGSVLGRGNYFIYTLPTSPLAELSIYLGLKGPLMYMVADEDTNTFCSIQANNLIKNKEAENVLAFVKNKNDLKIKLIKGSDQE